MGGNCFSKEAREENESAPRISTGRTRTGNNRGEQGTELSNLQQTGGTQRRTGSPHRSNNLVPPSAYAPERQRQTVGQESTPKEVAGADFNQYIRVDKLEGKFDPIDQNHEVGHSFSACFHVTNTTSDILKFTTPPPLEWKEIIHKKDGAEGKTEKEQSDQYAKKPNASTFIGWRWGWDVPIMPNETKQIIIQDNARVRNIDENDRTVSRSIEFDIGVPGNGPRLKATQNIEVINGVKKKLEFKIH